MNLALILTVQRWAPPQLQGRTLAAVEALANTAIGTSLLVGGLLLAPLGAQGVYLLAGGLGALALVVSLRIPRRPNPVRPDEQAAERSDERSGNSLDRVGPAPLPMPV